MWHNTRYTPDSMYGQGPASMTLLSARSFISIYKFSVFTGGGGLCLNVHGVYLSAIRILEE